MSVNATPKRPRSIVLFSGPGLTLASALGWLLLGLSWWSFAQAVPAPDGQARALTNQSQFTLATNAPTTASATNAAPAGSAQGTSAHVGGLSEQNVAMANAVIAENTLTLSLPGMGTSVDGPGPLTEADGPGLLAHAFYHTGTATGLSETRLSLERHHGSANRQTISRACASCPHKQLKQENEDHILSHYPRTGASD